MISKEAKQLIGKPVKWCRADTLYVRWHKGIVLDVKGRNVQVDHGGFTDWLWLPDIEIVPLETAPTLIPYQQENHQ